MGSFSGFIRKSPSQRLMRFFEARSVIVPESFDWTSSGRGGALVLSIEELLDSLPDRKQDNLKAELDHLASLANKSCLVSAEQVCAGHGIELEGFEGLQDILLMLAVDHPEIIDRIAAQSSLMRKTGGKQWSAFQFEDDGKPWTLDDERAREVFLADAIKILDLPDHRKREADWYKSIRINSITGEETEIIQATIYVEERPESELAFGASETLERQTVQKVLEVGIACDAKERIVEICAKGGKRIRDDYANAFAKNFAPQSATPIETPRRDVMLNILRSAPDFDVEPADGIDRIEVSSLNFFSTGGGFMHMERRGEDETIYQFLERRFGNTSPLKAAGWQITGATLRIILAATEGKRRRTLTVTLRTPNTTTLPNKTEQDRQFAFSLLERWGLLAPRTQEGDGLGES
ncbi:hypothetical protein [Pseudovibrio sp. Alg231-02]|uniref:hypothetical protein n=1 Tax=Pseudovibrio sp. Alg231-02 TaxID=1922223 RepID=UPI000D5629E3|nr:hypothetical protein [Pseudovibrio sp. Alg231-02]